MTEPDGMGKGDRQSAGGGGRLPSGAEGDPGVDVPQEEEGLTFTQAAKRAWIVIALVLLVVGLVLVLAFQPPPKINNKTIIQRQQTRIIQTPVPRTTVIERETRNTLVKPGPTVTKTAHPKPKASPSPRPSPRPSPTPTCQVIRIGGICVGAP